MKKLVSSIFFLFLFINLIAQSTNSKYDKALADSLGSDEYGMKMYILVLLKPGQLRLMKKQQTVCLMDIWQTSAGL
jgi:hypothetical protein